MDFSGIDTDGGHDAILSEFDDNVATWLSKFLDRYAYPQQVKQVILQQVSPAAQHSVYNANMLLYFVDSFDHAACEYPKPMLDENIASDYGKIMKLFTIGNRDDNFAVLDELLNAGEVQATQRRKFEFDKGFDRNDFISLIA